MPIVNKALGAVRELWPVFIVAIIVVIAGTLVGSVFTNRHPADAEELAGPAVTAVAHSADTQELTIADWSVSLSLPLVPELPLVSYVNHAGASVGFSSADLAPLGPACQAGRDALGSLIRVASGARLPVSQTNTRYFITTLRGYDYHYQLPRNACSDTEAGHTLVNRQTSILREALSSLAAASH